MPTYGSEYAAGADLYSCNENDIVIKPGETVKIGTGLAMQLPNGFFGGIFARSGIATKQGLRPSNCVGVVDSDYRGEIIVPLHNDSNEDQIVKPNQRIAQMILLNYTCMDFNEVNDLNKTIRDDKGFGSSGQ